MFSKKYMWDELGKYGRKGGISIYILARPDGVSTQLQSSGLVAHENSTFRNLALAVSGPFMA